MCNFCYRTALRHSLVCISINIITHFNSRVPSQLLFQSHSVLKGRVVNLQSTQIHRKDFHHCFYYCQVANYPHVLQWTNPTAMLLVLPCQCLPSWYPPLGFCPAAWWTLMGPASGSSRCPSTHHPCRTQQTVQEWELLLASLVSPTRSHLGLESAHMAPVPSGAETWNDTPSFYLLRALQVVPLLSNALDLSSTSLWTKQGDPLMVPQRYLQCWHLYLQRTMHPAGLPVLPSGLLCTETNLCVFPSPSYLQWKQSYLAEVLNTPEGIFQSFFHQ